MLSLLQLSEFESMDGLLLLMLLLLFEMFDDLFNERCLSSFFRDVNGNLFVADEPPVDGGFDGSKW